VTKRAESACFPGL